MMDEIFPFGLGMVMMMNTSAREDYDRLSETEKEHLILKCKDAKTKEEMDRIIDSISPAESAGDLLKGTDIG